MKTEVNMDMNQGSKLQPAEPPFIVRSDRFAGEPPDAGSYFNYIAAVQAIGDFLNRRFGTAFRLYYQDDGNEVWNGLEADLAGGYEGIEHAASLFDLVETSVFEYTGDPGQGKTGYAIRPAVRNNLFIYTRHRVALARVPRVTAHGLGYEDLIFGENDEGMIRFLEELRARQLADP